MGKDCPRCEIAVPGAACKKCLLPRQLFEEWEERRRELEKLQRKNVLLKEALEKLTAYIAGKPLPSLDNEL